MNMYLFICLICLAVPHIQGAGQAPAILESTRAQLQKPAMTSSYFMPEASQLAIIFPLKQLTDPPTAPASYTSVQMKRWNWLGGAGFLVLTRNDLGEHGILTELMYFPGLYQPQCMTDTIGLTKPNSSSLLAAKVTSSSSTCTNSSSSSSNSSSSSDSSNSSSDDGSELDGSMIYSSGDEHPTTDSSDGLYSAQRFWVDMQVSQAVGRAYFGYPKEAATFQWTQNSIAAKDSLGKTFLTVTFSNASNPSSSDSLPDWFLKVANGKIPTIQWPINDALTRLLARLVNDHTPAIDTTINKLPADVQKMLRAGAALAQSRAAAVRAEAGIRFLPNTQTLSFPGHSHLATVKVSKITFDGLVFTGQSSKRIQLASESAGVIVGTPGALSDPVPFNCY